MSKLYKKLGLYALSVLVLSSCDKAEMQTIHVDKPQSLIDQEILDSYAELKTYVNRAGSPGFHLGAALTAENYNAKGILTRIVNRNFDEVESNDFNHAAVVQADGSYNLGSLVTLMGNAKASQISVFGPALVTQTNQNATYLNSKIAPLVIQGAAARVVVADFDNDNLGTTYPMSNGGSGTVVVNNVTNSGRVLNVKGAQTFPRFNVTLPQGRVLGDYVSVVLDMYATGTTGLFGAGMRLSINGGALVSYGSPSSFGVADGVWSTGKIILPLATMNLTAQEKALSTFTLQVGSATGAANYYIDNVVLQDINVIKTPAQKTQIIDDELRRWISAVVDTSKSYIKVWDVVKDAIDDTNPSLIKTGVGKTQGTNEFYWQDYLGKDFAVRAFQLAREHGNSGDKFFIAENNLLSPAKLEGLINYITYIEGKNATIDGISADLNLSTTSDKAQIAAMLSRLASTGKLIRVAGLRVSASGATNEQDQLQSDMYKYVVSKYLELIPAAQRYGITLGRLIDGAEGKSTDASRAGLWIDSPQKSFFRKPAYVGFADALSGK